MTIGDRRHSTTGRRTFCSGAGAALAAAAAGESLLPWRSRPARAAGRDDVVRVLGVSTGALPDWSRFEKETGLKMEWTPASDDVGLFLHEMIADDAGEHYDIVTCLSGTYEALADQDLLLPIELGRLKNWHGVPDYVKGAVPVAPGSTPGSPRVWSIPYHMNADGFVYAPTALRMPHAPAEVSWKLIYDDERTKGRVAIDNGIYALGCAGIYLKYHRLVEIGDIGGMTPSECASVADFLIERKHAGQFRTLYKSYDEQLQLLLSGEVVAETAWEPVSHEAQRLGHDADYAFIVEGYDKWAQNLMIPSQVKARNGLDKVYLAMDWLLSGAYSAEMAATEGYVTPRMDLGLVFAQEHGWPAERIDRIREVVAKGDVKFAKPLYWDPGYFKTLEYYEREMARFRNA